MRKTGSSGGAKRPAMHATSLLLLAAQLLSLGHLLIVAHVTCPEHGDVIHTQRPHQALHRQAAASEGGSNLDATRGTAPQGDVEHDHCAVCSTTNERFALFSPDRQAGLGLEAALPVQSSLELAPFAPIDLIALSPKNSPPTV